MEDLQRPLPPRSTRDRARAWVAWIGFGRIVGSAVAVVVVCAGAFWLVRSPPPPTEATLPLVSTSAASVPVGASDDTVASVPLDAPASTGAPTVVVHVAGAVVAAGVYELPAGARVDGALAVAGGPVPDADPDALNLAAPVVDGSRIYVPRIGEEVPPTVTAQAVGTVGAVETGVPTTVDVNEASAAALEDLPGVGPATATAIVAERERNGPFLSVDDLERVAGIGPAKIDALRELVTT